MIARHERCDEEVPDGSDTPRGHQCRNRWAYEVMERNGETRRVCLRHLRRLERLTLVPARSEKKQSGDRNG